MLRIAGGLPSSSLLKEEWLKVTLLFFAADNILDATGNCEAGDNPPFSLLLLVGGETPTMAQTGGSNHRKLVAAIVAGAVAIVR
jgi:hypothetical protein